MGLGVLYTNVNGDNEEWEALHVGLETERQYFLKIKKGWQEVQTRSH